MFLGAAKEVRYTILLCLCGRRKRTKAKAHDFFWWCRRLITITNSIHDYGRIYKLKRIERLSLIQSLRMLLD